MGVSAKHKGISLGHSKGFMSHSHLLTWGHNFFHFNNIFALCCNFVFAVCNFLIGCTQ